jgi:hypothetical protein
MEYVVTTRGLVCHVETGELFSLQSALVKADAGLPLPSSLWDFIEEHETECRFFDDEDPEEPVLALEQMEIFSGRPVTVVL